MKGETAPNIAKSYQAMKKHAVEMSGQMNGLRDQLDVEKLKHRFAEKLQPTGGLLNVVKGMQLSAHILDQNTSSLFERAYPPSAQEALNSILAAMGRISEEVDTKTDTATNLLGRLRTQPLRDPRNIWGSASVFVPIGRERVLQRHRNARFII